MLARPLLLLRTAPPTLARPPTLACRARLRRAVSTMSSSSSTPSSSTAAPPALFFGPFDVATQVFYTTARSFALVNLKPLLPGHVLVCPRRPHRRLTDLDATELADLWTAVQVVQRMLAAHYFGQGHSDGGDEAPLTRGSFNIAVQDGPEAGQTVPHVHVHVLPRIRGATAKDAATAGDALYEQMAAEPGNVGGAQWDAAVAAAAAAAAAATDRLGDRPRPGGGFPRIEDSSRAPRPMAAMEAEAAAFRQTLARLGVQSQ